MANTIVDYHGEQSNYRCGYCKQPSSCQSNGMWAHIMTVQDYQDLVDRGWRRSGSYCYKPNNRETCCPCYTIKCDAVSFVLNKSHKKILKRMNKFLKDGIKEKHEESNEEKHHGEGVGNGEFQEVPHTPRNQINLANIVPKNVEHLSEGVDQVDGICLGTASSTSASNLSTKSSNSNAQPCKKAKLARLERKKEKLALKGLTLDDVMQNAKNKNVEKKLEDFLNEEPNEAKAAHKLRIKLIPSNKGATEEALKIYRKYQVNIHNDPPFKITKASYERFLIGSPLKATSGPNAPVKGYGSFHQQYWLDDRLIAVGVIDVLIHCVSSVYFFYDPEFSFLSLGTYASLREIAFTRELQKTSPKISNYYMGFYIHSCSKMRYKGRLNPSFLLCPEVYTWHSLDESLLAKLDDKKYQRFNSDASAVDKDYVSRQDLKMVLVLLGSQYMHYSDYQKFNKKSDEEVLEYSRLVGKTCANRMLLYRS